MNSKQKNIMKQLKQLQNNFTTPEQSKRLLDLRVPAWTANIMFDKNRRRYELIETEDESWAETQRTLFYNGCLQQPILSSGITIRADMLANNDGLSYDDWRTWFEDYDLSKPLAIIHFTPFRY